MRVKIKRLHPDAKMPTQGTAGAAGFDLYAIEDTALENGMPAKVRTGRSPRGTAWWSTADPRPP